MFDSSTGALFIDPFTALANSPTGLEIIHIITPCVCPKIDKKLVLLKIFFLFLTHNYSEQFGQGHCIKREKTYTRTKAE